MRQFSKWNAIAFIFLMGSIYDMIIALCITILVSISNGKVSSCFTTSCNIVRYIPHSWEIRYSYLPFVFSGNDIPHFILFIILQQSDCKSFILFSPESSECFHFHEIIPTVFLGQFYDKYLSPSFLLYLLRGFSWRKGVSLCLGVVGLANGSSKLCHTLDPLLVYRSDLFLGICLGGINTSYNSLRRNNPLDNNTAYLPF